MSSMWLQETLGGSLCAQNENFQGFLSMVIPHLLLNTKKDIYLKFRSNHKCYYRFTCGKYNSSLKNPFSWFGQFFNNFAEKSYIQNLSY